MNYSGTIALKAVNGCYVSAEGGGGQYLIANRNAVGAWETFKLIDLGNGQVALQASNGQYVSAQGGGGQGILVNGPAINTWEYFKLIDLGNGNITLQASNGQYVSAEAAGAQPLVANRDAASTWETFQLLDLASTVFIYQDGNFSGASQALTEGTYDINTLVIGNDQLSSLKVPSGMAVTLYEHGGFAGRTKTFTQDTPWVGDDFNDITSGIKVEKTKVIIYQDSNYNGASQVLTEGSYDYPSLTIGNDQLSSLRVPPGMKVTLYEHGAFNGRTKVFTQDTPWVGDDFNDITSGVKVERIGSNGIAPAATITPAAPLPSTPVPVISPNVLVFDGTSCYGCAQLNVSETAYTVSIWFKTTNNNCGIFSVDAGEQGGNGHDRHIWLSNGAICARVYANEVIQTANNTFADGAWHKVTHVFGGTIGGQRIYVDGQLEATGSKATSDFNWQDGINVGYSNDAQNPYFQGEISEVTIWSIARSEGAITSEKDMLAGNEQGLLAYWNFKDGKGNAIVDCTANHITLIINGNANWQRASDFSGVFTPIVHPEVIAAINEGGKQLAGAAKVLPVAGTDFTDASAPEPLSQLISNGALPQFEAGKRLSNAVQNNKLTLSKDLLGEFAEVGEIVSSIMNAFITINNPAIAFVKINPGTSGEDGESFGNDPTANLNLATAQTTALHISGGATIFSGLNVRLKYAEFSQFKGKPYGIFKFLINSQVSIAALLPNVPLLDGMVISNPVIILSSLGDIEDTTLNTYLLPANLADADIVDGTLVRGFNFFGGFKLGESADKGFRFIGNLLGVPEVVLHGAVDVAASTPAYNMEAVIPIDKYIVDGANFKLRFSKASIGVTIKGEPLEPAMVVSNQMVVTLINGSDKTDLVFTGGIKIETESITALFTMQARSDERYVSDSGNIVAEGEWKNPFGIPGITIRELAMQIGFTYEEPWIDNIGVHGNLKIGDIDGSISVLVDSNDPDQFVLAGASDHLTIFDIMSCMCVPTFVAYQAIPTDIKQVMDNFVNLSLNNVKIYIVPVSTSIGAIDFEQGITVMGALNAWGWQASVLMKIDYLEGLEVHGEMDNINLSNVLRITGSQNNPAPLLNLTLSPKTIPELLVTGSIYLLGLSQELLIKADSSGFTFYFERAVTNILDVKLTCSFGDGGNLVAGGSIVFNLNLIIPTPFGNVSLVNVSFDAATSLKVGPKYGFETTISGSFSFYGHNVTMPTLTLSVAPNDFTGIFNAVVSQIADNAVSIFRTVFGTLAEWADAVKNGTIQLTNQVAAVAKNVYNAAEGEVIAAYQTLNESANEIAAGFKDVYGYSGQAVATALRGANYATAQVASALGSAYQFSETATATALQGAGYAVEQVSSGIQSAYNLSEQGVAIALKGAGYTIDQVGTGIQSAFNLTGQAGAQAVATALNGAGYAVSETGNFVKNTYGLTADALNSALQGAGYAANQVGGFLQGLGGTFTDVGNTILGVGETVKDGIETAGDTVKDGLDHAFNPSRW